jgi:hypothetical protein
VALRRFADHLATAATDDGPDVLICWAPPRRDSLAAAWVRPGTAARSIRERKAVSPCLQRSWPHLSDSGFPGSTSVGLARE